MSERFVKGYKTVTDLDQKLDRVLKHTGWADPLEIIEQEYEALVSTARAGQREATDHAEAMLSRWEMYWTRAAAVLPKLRMQNHTSLAVERQLVSTKHLLPNMLKEWEEIVSDLAAPTAKERLPAIRRRMEQARNLVHACERSRVGFGQMLADVERTVAVQDL